MSYIIEEFYYGNIEPQETTTELKPQLKKKLKALSKTEELLISILKGKEKELFETYIRQSIEFSSTSNADGFIAGFRLGAKFTYDTFVVS